MKKNRLLFFSLVVLGLFSSFSLEASSVNWRTNFHLLFLYDFTRIRDTIVTKTNSFSLRRAYLDFRAELNKALSARFYLDVADLSGRPSFDLYGSFKPVKNLEFRFGKFKQSLGYEINLSAHKLNYIEPSLISRLRAPAGSRDIGVGVFWAKELLEANLNLVNGSGKDRVFDDNEAKDLSGRLVVKPNDFLCGLNFYLGDTGRGKMKDLLFYRRLGAEIGYISNSLELLSEFLYGRDEKKPEEVYGRDEKKYEEVKGLYLSLGYKIQHFMPLFRFDWLKKDTKEPENFFTVGLNYMPLKDAFKVFNHFSLHRVSEKEVRTKFSIQLQVYI